ncbi:hypothetical protein THAOC_22306, partial [Thalassiosira oceanica]
MAPCIGPSGAATAVEFHEGNAPSGKATFMLAPSGPTNDTNDTTANPAGVLQSPDDVHRQIARGVVRAKLSKRRHLVLPR